MLIDFKFLLAVQLQIFQFVVSSMYSYKQILTS